MSNPRGNPNWKPGQSGNPGGRPRENDQIRAVKEMMRANAAWCYARMIELAQSGDEKVAAKMIELLAGYTFGRPAQTVHIDDQTADPAAIAAQAAAATSVEEASAAYSQLLQ
jgi:hypothetical protein